MPLLEGTGQKPRRVRGKSGVQIAAPKGPTVRSRVVTRVTPKKNTAVALAGIGGLGQALSGFFKEIGKVGEAVANIEQEDSLAKIRQANAIELSKIKEENRELSLIGAAKALKGEKLTTEEAGRHASLDAFENTLGAKIGWDLSAKWTLHMAQLPEGVGTQEAWEAFIKEELKNSKITAGIGTGNPRVDVAIMAVLERSTAKGRRDRQLQRAKLEMNKQALTVLSVMIEEVTNNGSNFNLEEFVGKLKLADPRRAHLAEANAIATLIAWAGQNRGKGTQVIQILETAGANKRMGLVAWNKLVNGLVNQQNKLKNLKGREAYEGFMANFIPKLGGIPVTSPQEFARVYQVVQLELTRIANIHGRQSGLYTKALSAMTKLTTKFGTAATAIQKIRVAMSAVLTGASTGNIDVPPTKKYFSESMTMLNRGGVNNPTAEAAALARLHAASTINATKKAEYTHALTNFTPAFGNVMRTLMGFAALSKGNEDAVMNLIGSEVHTIYKAAVSDFKLGKTWDEIASRIAEERRDGSKFEHTFKQMVLDSSSVGTLGKKGTESEAQTAVMELINEALKDKFKGLDNVSDQTLRVLSKMGLREWAILKQGDSSMTAKRSVELFVEAVVSGGRLTLVPGAGDNVQLTFTRQPKHGTEISVGPVIDVTELPHVSVAFGTRTSQNGFTEDTTETYRLDRNDIAKFAFTGLSTKIGGAISSDSISLLASHLVAAPRGLYVIKSNGQAITFHPGQTITFAGKEITLPKNVTDAVAFLENLNAFEEGAKKGVSEEKKRQEALAATRAPSIAQRITPAKLTHRQKTMNKRIVYLVVGDAIILTYRPGFVEDPAKRPLTGRELNALAEKRAAEQKKQTQDFLFSDLFVGG